MVIMFKLDGWMDDVPWNINIMRDGWSPAVGAKKQKKKKNILI